MHDMCIIIIPVHAGMSAQSCERKFGGIIAGVSIAGLLIGGTSVVLLVLLLMIAKNGRKHTHSHSKEFILL